MSIKNVDKYCYRLKSISRKAIEKSNYELALQSISACCNILYKYNQQYTDLDLEKYVSVVSQNIIHFSDKWEDKRNAVLFYDSFGVDRRGVAIVMCKAIVMNGYHLVYVSPLGTKGTQPTMKAALDDYDVEWIYYNNSGTFLDEVQGLVSIFEECKPKFTFLYTTPYDVSGISVFNALKGKCFRNLLDLTDHAFWLGINAFDFCNGGRQFAGSIEHCERGIPLEKMLLLDANLLVDDCQFQGLPFDEKSRFVFSGGQLYKTLGDENNTFYRIVNHILNSFTDVKFLYVGSGDDSKIKLLEQKYPERVFLMPERPDFYQIMKRCTLYLNTYPMFGGLMMRYAALAKKIPLTLRHENDSDGLLIDQEKRNIEYDSYDELIADIDKLLSDEKYLLEREKLLEGAVVTEECYVRNIRMMIEEHKTEFTYDEIKPVDTTKFRKEFADRFTYGDLAAAIAQRRNTKLIHYFPKEFIYRIYINLKKKV